MTGGVRIVLATEKARARQIGGPRKVRRFLLHGRHRHARPQHAFPTPYHPPGGAAANCTGKPSPPPPFLSRVASYLGAHKIPASRSARGTGASHRSDARERGSEGRGARGAGGIDLATHASWSAARCRRRMRGALRALVLLQVRQRPRLPRLPAPGPRDEPHLPLAAAPSDSAAPRLTARTWRPSYRGVGCFCRAPCCSPGRLLRLGCISTLL